jgi:hypothetical protein
MQKACFALCAFAATPIFFRGEIMCSRMISRSVLLSLTFFLLPQPGSGGALDSLGITITGASRPFAFTNKQSAFYYGETNAYQRPGWMGFHVAGVKVLEDYEISTSGIPLNRQSATTVVSPDFLVRTYDDGTREEFHMADSLPLFWVVLELPHARRATITIRHAGGKQSGSGDRLDDGDACALKVTREDAGDASWIAMFTKDGEMMRGPADSAGLTLRQALITPISQKAVFVFATGKTAAAACSLARNADLFIIAMERKMRLEGLLAHSSFTSGNRAFDQALAWAKLSLDALIMHQGKIGIFAGLPWFANYWGRDTFISLPGATLATGSFELAKQILESFASYQNTDSLSRDFGRIPNVVNLTDRAYNTADGTPRFVIDAKEYVLRSGDLQFARDIYPVILRATEGTMTHHLDSLGFLTHGDAETWMDAVGPEGPWSPRGSRANDVQALWAAQLEASSWFGEMNHDVAHSRQWKSLHAKLLKNFARSFVRGGVVIDHLTPDGSPDNHLRPNQIFTAQLLSPLQRAQMIERVVNGLTYTYGVSSLSQSDTLFHPYHEHPPYYPKDAAYHNGTVWTWLQGEVISQLCAFDLPDSAWQLTHNTIHQILDRGGVGTQSELLDALPHSGEPEPRLSGTFSQAWNLAEFVRNAYDDYLGFSISVPARTITLNPKFPKAWKDVHAVVYAGADPIELNVRRTKGGWDVALDASSVKEDYRCTFRSTREVTFDLPSHGFVLCTLRGDQAMIHRREGRETLVPTRSVALPAGLKFHFLRPHLRENLPSLRGVPYPLLAHDEVVKRPVGMQPLVDVADSVGDDTGVACDTCLPVRYSYPRTDNFVSGCMDITRFRLWRDATRAYIELTFRALANPGWHPEYGFQLTMAAIAIDSKPGGQSRIGHNAGYSLREGKGFERLILVGGGLQIEDEKGNILAAYAPVPEDARAPLGDDSSGVISFSLPHSLLPAGPWHITVLAGGQDDHGGAGIGEFRTVTAEAGEWNGGGKIRPADSNIYDILDALVP